MVRNNDLYMYTLQKALTNMSNHLLFKNIPYYMSRYNACRWPRPGCKQLLSNDNDWQRILLELAAKNGLLRPSKGATPTTHRTLTLLATRLLIGPTSASRLLPATHDVIQGQQGSLYCRAWVRGLTFKWRSLMKFILAVTASSKQVSACRQKGAGGAA
jgi:hypothetical protein